MDHSIDLYLSICQYIKIEDYIEIEIRSLLSLLYSDFIKQGQTILTSSAVSVLISAPELV